MCRTTPSYLWNCCASSPCSPKVSLLHANCSQACPGWGSRQTLNLDRFTCGQSCTPAISKSDSKLIVTICSNFSIPLPFQVVVWDTHALASISYSLPRKPILLKNNDQSQGTSPLPAAPPFYTGLPRAFFLLSGGTCQIVGWSMDRKACDLHIRLELTLSLLLNERNKSWKEYVHGGIQTKARWTCRPVLLLEILLLPLPMGYQSSGEGVGYICDSWANFSGKVFPFIRCWNGRAQVNQVLIFRELNSQRNTC